MGSRARTHPSCRLSPVAWVLGVAAFFSSSLTVAAVWAWQKVRIDSEVTQHDPIALVRGDMSRLKRKIKEVRLPGVLQLTAHAPPGGRYGSPPWRQPRGKT